jgi:hypothetical protein
MTCHQWLTIGAWAILILPTIWAHMCSVSRVSVQSGTRSRINVLLDLLARRKVLSHKPRSHPDLRSERSSSSLTVSEQSAVTAILSSVRWDASVKRQAGPDTRGVLDG